MKKLIANIVKAKKTFTAEQIEAHLKAALAGDTTAQKDICDAMKESWPNIVKATGTTEGATGGHATRKSAAADATSQTAHEASAKATGDDSQDGDCEAAADAHEAASGAHEKAMMAQAKAGNADKAGEHAKAMVAHDAMAEAFKTGEKPVITSTLAWAMGEVVKSKDDSKDSYGFCPHCAAPGVSRTRGGKDAKDTCENGHCYPATAALETKAKASEKGKGTEVIRATSRDIIRCRASGSKLPASEPWVQDQPVKFCYMPGGLHTITAGFSGPITKGRDSSINLTIDVDPERDAPVCQASMDSIKAEQPKQDLFGCYEHDEKKASVWADSFEAGQDPVHGEPAILLAARPSGDGAADVNAKNWRSWSPSFGTNAEYGKCKCRGCNETIQACECAKPQFFFPEGVRGSLSSPAQITGVDGVVGTLTNKPAFRAMPPVKAKQTETVTAKEMDTTGESETYQDKAKRAALKSKVAKETEKTYPAGENHGEKLNAHRNATWAHQDAAASASDLAVKQYHFDAAKSHDDAAQEHAKVTAKEEFIPDTATILASMPLARTVDDILVGMTGYHSASAELDAEEDILKACSGVAA